MSSAPQLYVDVNVVIDFGAARQTYGPDALALFGLAKQGRVQLYIAASTPAFSYYAIEQYLRKTTRLTSTHRVEATYAAVNAVLKLTTLVTIDDALISAAIDSPIDDLEDAVQYVCAQRCNAAAIITRDNSGVEDLPIPALSPKAWLTQHFSR